MRVFLTELAYKRSKALDKIEESSVIILEHVFKILIFNNTRETNHWVSEIQAQLIKIFTSYSNIKGGNFSFKDYWSAMVRTPYESDDQDLFIKNTMKIITVSEDEITPSIWYNSLTRKKTEEIDSSVKNVYKKIITNYSNHNVFTNKELMDVIQSEFKDLYE